ncbi:uncharacterized protein LOC119738162 [Patiria miniata]|uniref:Ig-like domain-containing protein n=1 Tax=Patiria miniata TaxID=46514 RepID=A0A914AYU9_PATMI|nr:uncharacterized protein LOC119738162 [Patiria miniata]XP_038068839.1 uncharacterized protein LOC119738162 [Patiria miniata]
MIKAHKADLWMVLLLVAIGVQASHLEDGAIFLERGNPGILSCPLVASGRIPLDQIEVMYWYFPQVRDEDILISYFLGNVAPQNGIPEGVYDINRNFSLVVENVTESDGGTYFCRVKPKWKVVVDGHVTMRVKVSPTELFPDVTQCTARITETACEAVLPYDIKNPWLMCIVRDTKPAVALRWLLEYSDGDTQLISDRFTVQPSEYSVNTFTTSASIPIIASNSAPYMYRCQAYGEALGARNGSHVTVTVTVTTAHHTTQTPHFPPVATSSAVTDKEAPYTSHNAVIGPTDTPDGYRYAFIATTVALCLALVVIVGLVIAVCKLQTDSKADNSNDTVANHAGNLKRFSGNEGSKGELCEMDLESEVLKPLHHC